MSRNNQIAKRILTTGVSGLLGSNLAWAYKDRYTVLGIYHRHAVAVEGMETKRIDLLNAAALEDCFHSFQPDVVIHCAALTDVDYCEEHPEEAEAINAKGTQNVVESLKGLSAQLIYISTDAVFDGTKGDYKEEDSVNPISHYGRTKYEGETFAWQREGSIVARTSIFGWNVQTKESLGEWILHRLMRQETLRGFQDILTSVIYTFELAKLLEELWKKGASGLFHCASSTALSKYDFAVKLAEAFGFNPAEIQPSFAEAALLKARRGKNLSLCTKKLEIVLDRKSLSLGESIQKFYEDYQTGLPQKIRSCLSGMSKN